MPAVCAVCLLPITPTQKFVLDRTEVLHPGCARTGGTTLLQKVRAELARAQVAVATAHRVAAEHGSRASEIERRRQQDSLEHLRQAHHVTEELRRAHAEIDRLQAEVAAARREAALHRTLTATPQQPTTPELTTPTTPKDERDDTTIRMSLLDLDPT